jgi:SAM-dependent methyltransferase
MPAHNAQPDKPTFKYSWEEAIEILRNDPAHHDLIFNSYLTRDLVGNCERFADSAEFAEVLALLGRHGYAARLGHPADAHPQISLLDMPGGNGIATYAFARAGYDVTSVEPDPSPMMGRGAIAQVLDKAGLRARIVEAWGEALPFSAGSFDVAYVRQGLHHARDLPKMVAELGRVLRPGGVLLATREHVVDNYGESLKAFLAAQVDHQLYGGEHAFTLPDYKAAISKAGLELVVELGAHDSIINAFPNTPDVLREKILMSRPGQMLRKVLPDNVVAGVGLWHLKRRKAPGRMYSFLAVKPRTSDTKAGR